MSTQNDTASLAARLRALRGDESQEKFAHRVGITRSALANYETGRTTPKRSVLRSICQKLGISESVLIDGEIGKFEDLAGALGAYAEAGTLPGLTDDERAIIRVLRICDPRVVASVVAAIIAGLEAQQFDRRLADPLTIQDDIVKLYRISELDGFFVRGTSPDTLSAIVDVLRRKHETR